MPPRKRNNKKKKDQKPLTSASDVLLSAKPEVSAAIQSGSDSSEENAPQESKKAPAEPAAHLSPQVAESKQGSSPGGPRSSEKPTRPATLATAQTLSAKVEAPRSAAKEQPSSSMSPEVKRLEFDSRSEEKSSDKKHSSAHKNASGAKDESKGQFSSPQRAPAEDPPNEIVESFRSARKAIENSADGADRSFRRDRSDSLDEVLKEHPHIVDPLTGDVSGNLVPSREVLQHHQRTASAKELVGLGTASPNLQKTYDNTSPKHNTAVALTNTAKALEGKLSMPKKVERRPSLNILLDSGILQIPEDQSPASQERVQRKTRSLAHLEEQQFLDALSPLAPRSRVDEPFQSSPNARKYDGDISAPAFSSPMPSSVTHIYEYIPYKILEKRVVISLALRILSELKKREMIDGEQVGVAKHKIFRGDIGVVMAVEQFACNRDLEVFVAVIYDIACEKLEN